MKASATALGSKSHLDQLRAGNCFHIGIVMLAARGVPIARWRNLINQTRRWYARMVARCGAIRSIVQAVRDCNAVRATACLKRRQTGRGRYRSEIIGRLDELFNSLPRMIFCKCK